MNDEACDAMVCQHKTQALLALAQHKHKKHNSLSF